MSTTAWCLVAGVVLAAFMVLLAAIMQVPSYPEDIQKQRARSALTESLEALRANAQELSDGNGQHRDDGQTRDLRGYPESL